MINSLMKILLWAQRSLFRVKYSLCFLFLTPIIDSDSDNDGIFDVVESGNEALDTNGDGRIDIKDSGFGL